MIAPMPLTQSINSFPSMSQNRAPSARFAYTGDTPQAKRVGRRLINCVPPGINSHARSKSFIDLSTLEYGMAIVSRMV